MDVPTTFDFSRDGGFARAVELCNGAGVCRKLQTGTMCPSFMVTRDEEHSTRGRANALRMVLSGALPPEELTGERLFETYDLCLQCKGCKAECPSNVDVAKLKMEFLDGYYRKHGAPLGVRLMANAATAQSAGRGVGAAVELGHGSCPAQAGSPSKCSGIDPRRPLPRFERQPFSQVVPPQPASDRQHATGERPAPRGPIVLLDDCLTSYCEPGVNRAAVRGARSRRLRSPSGRARVLRPHVRFQGLAGAKRRSWRERISRACFPGPSAACRSSAANRAAC